MHSNSNKMIWSVTIWCSLLGLFEGLQAIYINVGFFPNKVAYFNTFAGACTIGFIWGLAVSVVLWTMVSTLRLLPSLENRISHVHYGKITCLFSISFTLLGIPLEQLASQVHWFRHEVLQNGLLFSLAIGVSIIGSKLSLDQHNNDQKSRFPSKALAIIALAMFALLSISPTYFLAKTLFRATSEVNAATADDYPNILMLTVDTLRADHLSIYGYTANQTPNIDHLMRKGVRFHRCIAQAPWTLPSLAALNTGLPPSFHGAGHEVIPGQLAVKTPLSQELDTLAETLQKHGYATAAIVTNAWFSDFYGMDQGFQRFENLTVCSEVFITCRQSMAMRFLLWLKPSIKPMDRARDVTDEAIAFIQDHRTSPLFLWLHYSDPHAPYLADPDTGINSMRCELEWGAIADVNGSLVGDVFANLNGVKSGMLQLSKVDRQKVVSMYDTEITYTDRHIGRLLDDLKQSVNLDEWLVVFAADHGEEFWDHNGFEHAHSFYEEVIRVPLAIIYPEKVPQDFIVDQTVGLNSVYLTLMELVGLEMKALTGMGPSLKPMWNGRDREKPYTIISELNTFGIPGSAVIHEKWKYITWDTGLHELYNLEDDPLEQKNLAAFDEKLWDMRKYQKAYQTVTQRIGRRNLESGTPDASTFEALRALGYVQ